LTGPLRRRTLDGVLRKGEIVMQLKSKPAVTLKTGQTFYEDPTDVHAVRRNAATLSRPGSSWCC